MLVGEVTLWQEWRELCEQLTSEQWLGGEILEQSVIDTLISEHIGLAGKDAVSDSWGDAFL